MESVVSYVNSVEVCRGLSRVCRASVEFYVEVSRPGLDTPSTDLDSLDTNLDTSTPLPHGVSLDRPRQTSTQTSTPPRQRLDSLDTSTARALSSFVKFRQVSSSFVKFRQVLSSFVKDRRQSHRPGSTESLDSIHDSLDTSTPRQPRQPRHKPRHLDTGATWSQP